MPETTQTIPVALPSPHRPLALGLVLLLLLAAGLLTYRASERAGLQQMRAAASHQLDILAAAIDSEVTRHASIPSAVELSPDVRALLRAPEEGKDVLAAAANRFLQVLSGRFHHPGGA